MPTPSEQSIKQAGAIVFKGPPDARQVLLTTARQIPDQRIFPKGHIQSGETGEEAARRELKEETGVLGRPSGFVATITFDRDGRTYQVSYYLFEYEGEVTADEGRKVEWCDPADASRRLTFPESRTLLEKALVMTRQRGSDEDN